MSGPIGADPESLDGLASQLGGFRDTLHATSRHLTSGVHERAWKGTRADRFRSDWDHLYVPWINGACDWLDRAVTALHDNANQQRVASGGEPKDYSTGLTHLLHRAERAVDAGIHGANNWRVHELRDAQRMVREVDSDFHAGLAEMVKSPVFAEVMDVAQKVATIAPLLAIVPGLGEVAAVVGLAAGAVILAGDVATMANSGDWDYKRLARDGVDVALSAAGAGALGAAAKGASEANLATQLGKTYQTGSLAANSASNILVLRSVKDLYDVGSSSVEVVSDVRHGDYRDAALDGFSAVAAGTESVGSAKHVPLISEPYTHLVDSTAKTSDLVRDNL